ncbi:uncharacterized protein LOC135374642 [Ornithodoros turicata]|uniref:uncharacterized protein LOC135374642 n=1 Tax=Ornithodoros turicata TaxID=34597 RepID=UPI003139C835
MRRGDIPEAFRRRVVDWVYYDLCTYSMYPGKLYREAAQQLVRRYPVLRDVSLEGHGSWYMALRNKGKNGRRRLGNSMPEVNAAMEKRRSHKEKGAEAHPREPQHIPRECTHASVFGEGEDEASINGHMAFMAKEMRKRVFDKEKVKNAMDRTFQARRNWIKTERPLVQDVLNKYPALRHEEEVRNEFQRLTGVEADTSLLSFINNCGEKVLQLASQKRALQAELKAFWKELEQLPTSEQKYYFAIGVIKSLPGLLRENWQRLVVKLEPGIQHTYPTITYTGDDLLTTGSISVVAEGLSVNVLDATSAVSLLLCLYWTFNIEYSPVIKNTLSVLERMMGVKYTRLTALPLRVVTALTA